MQLIHEILVMLNEASVYLLLGFALAGLLHIVLERFPAVTRMMTGRGKRPVLMATLLGLPMPLCSCGVLPAALALRKEGASKGATSSFLISVPETDIVSIILTYALLGPLLAIYRPVAALITALGTGFAVDALDTERVPAPAPPAASGCCESESKTKQQVWPLRALRFGFIEMFDDIIGRLLLGMVIAGGLMALLPGDGLSIIGGGSALTYLVMLLIGVPVYVCATASTPVAVGLIAAGVSPGAALVFLLAGPATNLAGILVIARSFGRRALAVYLASIAVLTVLFGVLLDRLLGGSLANLSTPAAHEHGVSWIRIAATAGLLVLAAASFYRTRPWTRLWRLWSKRVQATRGAMQHVKLSTRNPDRCTPSHDCRAHDSGHRHGPRCGHSAVSHDGHVDYVVGGHLHHPHGDHCDDHGPLETTSMVQ